MNSTVPHNREAAVQSVVGDTPTVTDYKITPLSIKVYDHAVGIVHYAYSASIAPKNSSLILITGKWSGVYLNWNNEWVMISVSGKPDLPAGGHIAIE